MAAPVDTHGEMTAGFGFFQSVKKHFSTAYICFIVTSIIIYKSCGSHALCLYHHNDTEFSM